jgi:pimeloyl-ACP methyl ester carboxylesterase
MLRRLGLVAAVVLGASSTGPSAHAAAAPSSLPTAARKVRTRFVQVGPEAPGGEILRSPGQKRALVLVHGLRYGIWELIFPPKYPCSAPEPTDWLKPNSRAVKALAREGDVFAFSYGQDVPITEVARAPLLLHKVRELRWAGYTEVVLIGHSAGGIVVRQFVEDHPDAGVTKVVQVCAPNGGASLTVLARFVVREPGLKPFIDSLGPMSRESDLRARAGKKLPAGTQFVCVLGASWGKTDGVVNWSSTWCECLQKQNIPFERVERDHTPVMYKEDSIKVLCRLVREPQPRWRAAEVARGWRELFGAKAGPGLARKKEK